VQNLPFDRPRGVRVWLRRREPFCRPDDHVRDASQHPIVIWRRKHVAGIKTSVEHATIVRQKMTNSVDTVGLRRARTLWKALEIGAWSLPPFCGSRIPFCGRTTILRDLAFQTQAPAESTG